MATVWTDRAGPGGQHGSYLGALMCGGAGLPSRIFKPAIDCFCNIPCLHGYLVRALQTTVTGGQLMTWLDFRRSHYRFCLQHSFEVNRTITLTEYKCAPHPDTGGYVHDLSDCARANIKEQNPDGTKLQDKRTSHAEGEISTHSCSAAG